MFTNAQLEFFESRAIPRSMDTLSKLAAVIRQLQGGDALGNPLPPEVVARLEAQMAESCLSYTETIKTLANAIKVLYLTGNPKLLDDFIAGTP